MRAMLPSWVPAVDVGDLRVLLVNARPYFEDTGMMQPGGIAAAVADRPEGGGKHGLREALASACAVSVGLEYVVARTSSQRGMTEPGARARWCTSAISSPGAAARDGQRPYWLTSPS